MSDSSAGSESQKPIVSDDGKDQDQKPEHVPYSTYRQLLDEKKKEQAEKRALADKVAEFDRAAKEKEEENLRKKGDYETIIKNKDAELKQTKELLSAREQKDLRLRKLSNFLNTAGGDIDSRFIENGLVNVDSIIVDPSTGEIDQMSVTKAVDSFKQVWPEAFKKPGARLPTDAPNGSSKITYAEWKNLPLKEMKKWKPDQIAD